MDLSRHKGQTRWVENSTKLVNILVPGNQWGKTLVLSCQHIYQNMTKHELAKFGISQDIQNMRDWSESQTSSQWFNQNYTTLNFGKTYEIALSVHETILMLINGEYELVDPDTNRLYFNQSKLKGVIRKAKEGDNPEIEFINNARMLTRSVDDMGSSFKRRRLAFVSGDECGDIPNIKELLNVTLLPRIAFFQGKINLVGTPQNPGEYQELVEEAEGAMEELEEASDYYVQRGTMYENPGLSRDHVKRIEAVADDDLKRRIVRGEFVETGNRFFQMVQVENAINDNLTWDRDSGIIEMCDTEGKYVVVVDMAASNNDRTVILVLRYDANITRVRLVYMKFFRGKEVPLPMQYEMVLEVYDMYSGGQFVDLVYDGQSLGGKHAEQQFKHIHPTKFPPQGMTPADAKARALGALRALLDNGRSTIQDKNGNIVDVVEDWGGLEMPYIRAVRVELEGYKLDDKNIRNDIVITLAQGAFYVSRKRKHSIVRTRSWDILGGTIN